MRVGIGVDVAGMGKNRTVLALSTYDEESDRPRHRVLATSKHSKTTTPQVARLVDQFERSHARADVILIDFTGVGEGVYYQAREELGPERVFPFVAAGSPEGRKGKELDLAKKRFVNVKAQACIYLADLFTKEDIAIPNDPEMKVDLGAWKVKINDKGKFLIIDPPQDKSPDIASAVMMSIWGAARVKGKVWVG